jgi:hypothetical protein
VAEFTKQVRDRALVLAGGCVDLGAADLPYAPFTAALRDLVRQRGPAEVAGLLPGNGPRELARLLPELGSPATDSDPEMTRGRLFGALLTLLDRLAGQRPLVLVIEDLHWTDRSTGDLLAFLVRNLPDDPVLLVVTFRSDEVDDAPGLARLLAELGRMDGASRLELTRLSRGQVAAQLEGILGRPADPALAGAVYQRGGGNPLFTEALLGSDGVLSPGLPWSLRELLLSRIKELPAQTQQVLRTAAVGDGTTGHALLAAVTGLGDAALDDALRHSVSAGVLVTDGDGYAFRHELFREALREDLLPGERTRAHRAFASALAASPSLSPGHLPSARLAVHWHGAGEHEQALRAASAAAADAAAASAYAEHLQMLELVLELWERAPDAAGQAGTDRAGVMEAAAEAAWLAGEPERGLPLVEAALDGLDETRDAQRAASLLRLRAALRQQLLLPGQADDLRAALRLAADPSPVRAHALGQLIRALRLRNLDEEARPLVTQLRSLAERLPDDEDRVEAQIRLVHYRDGVADLRERAETARRIGSASQEIHARLGITHLLETQGEHEAAIRAGQQDLARARQLGLARYATAPAAGNLADSLVSAGRWDEATEIIADGLGLNLAPFGRAPAPAAVRRADRGRPRRPGNR